MSLCQHLDNEDKVSESVMQVKSFPTEVFVNAELLFRTITKEISRDILQVCSVIADTTALNAGRI